MIQATLLSISLIASVLAEEPKKRFQDFSVEELKEMGVVERLKLNDWRLESTVLALTAVVAILYKLGDFYNSSQTKKFLNGLKDVFEKNFYQYGVSSKDLYIKDNSECYSSYATGRVNIESVEMKIKLQPRHNIFIWIMEYVLSFFTESVVTPVDKVDFIITPSKDVEYDNFIFAVVSKLGMNDFRKFNYYLSLTKTSDSPSLPGSYVFMSEAVEFQEKLLTEELKSALSLSSASYLKYIAFTDQPVERPDAIKDLSPDRRIIVSTSLATGKDELEVISKGLAAVFSIVDKLAQKRITFKNETMKKVLKTREVEVGKLKKIEEEILKEKANEEKARLKREEKERTRNLSRQEQLALEKKANEKKQRKLQRKQKVRMQ